MFDKKIVFVVITLVLIIGSSYAQQFNVEVFCDKEDYYTNEIVDISVSLKNLGESRYIDLYLVYFDPTGSLYYGHVISGSKSRWKNLKNGSQISEFIKKAFVPKEFYLPLTSINFFFYEDGFPYSYKYPYIFGDFTFYFAVADSDTNEIISNISSFKFDKLKADKGEWTNYPNVRIQKLSLYGDTLWCTGNSGAISTINISTEEIELFPKFDGLPDGRAWQMEADSKGRKWFINHNDDSYGVATLDGDKWQYFNMATGHIQVNNSICIALDKDENVWTALEGRIYFYDGITWERINYFLGRVKTMLLGPDDKIWIGTDGGEINIFESEDWVNYHDWTNDVEEDGITDIAFDSKGNVWIGFESKGIVMFDGEYWVHYKSSNSGLLDMNVLSIAVDHDDVVWIGTYSGVYTFDGESWNTYTPDNCGIAKKWVYDILVDPSNRKWFATWGDTLSMFDGENWKTYRMSDENLAGGRSVEKDSKGRIWVADYPKLTVYDGEIFTHYNRENSGFIGDSGYGVYDLAIDSEDRIWICSDGNGIIVFDEENWYYHDSSVIPCYSDNEGRVIAVDPEDRVWLGTKSQGLFLYDGSLWVNLDTPDKELFGHEITGIDFESSGKAWIASNYNAVFSFDGENWVKYGAENSSLVSYNVTALHIDRFDRKWIGSDKGAMLFDDYEWTLYDSSNSHLNITNNHGIVHITTIESDESGNIYFGSNSDVSYYNYYRAGLSIFDGENWVTYDMFNSELLGRGVLDLVVDSEGKKWIATTHGLSILKDSQLSICN